MTAAVFAEWHKYAERILRGSKRYEYRKRLARRHIDVIYIYETQPTCAVVGMVDVIDQGYESALDLWLETMRQSGMDITEWRAYVGRSETIAYYELANPHRFPTPIPLPYFGIDRAPQSFAYVPEDLELGQLSLIEGAFA